MNRGGSQEERHGQLRRALEEDRAAGRTATVLCHLQATEGSGNPTAEETDALAERVITRVIASAGQKPRRRTVLRHLGALRIEAEAAFLLNLIDQPEVREASASGSTPGSADLIRPVRKKPATESGWTDVS
jgi:hypothetical protein